MPNEPAHEDNSHAKEGESQSSPRQWTSRELLEGQAEAIIVHAGEVYRLRCTRNNKLILTK